MEAVELRRMIERCGPACAADRSAETLNRECFCVAVSPAEVKARVNQLLRSRGLGGELGERHEHLFAPLPVFVPRAHVECMERIAALIAQATASPAFAARVLAWAPAIAGHDPGSPGGLLGLDFHLAPDGPRLIEINTNPGGLLLNAVLAEAQQLCLPAISSPGTAPGTAEAGVDVLLHEWALQRSPEPGEAVAIVDEAPADQYLHAEFALFQRLLLDRGIPTHVVDPSALEYVEGKLVVAGQPVGFVYNRLTDFALERSDHARLRRAYLDGAVALSPHPRAHALQADKRNLVVLGDVQALQDCGLSADAAAELAAGVPRTEVMSEANREDLWARRRELFFKPATGYGSRASYRGDKLTHKTWEQMASTAYVAQQVVPPSERRPGDGADALKVDIRAYAYEGRVLGLAARTYRGQTTNFRTPGGGFAPVVTLEWASGAPETQNRPKPVFR